ncbi:MAG: hypothetical protein ACK4P1_12860, partial [Aggregatilineales bacterium]
MGRRLSKAVMVMLWLCALWRGASLRAQAELPRAPISALWSDGARLLIGQGGALFEVAPTADRLVVRWQIGLGRGALQALAVCPPFTFVLSADGVSVLDSERRERAFAAGGGHRLACNGDQIWVAALSAGVRRYRVSSEGRLSALEPLRTTAPAHDVVASGATAFWVAEGVEGVRRYDLEGIARLWLNTFTPAQALRESADKLYIGHGGQLSILSLGEPLRLIGSATLTPDDAIVFELIGAQLRIVGQFGEDGDGARLAALGADVFVVGGGAFTWLRFTEATPRLITTWSAAPPQCALNVPTDPQPADGAQVRV